MKYGPRLAAALVFFLGAYLRLHHLGTSPEWYPDEGSNIAIAASLARGEQAYLAFGRSSFINSHPHLFYFLLAGLFRIWGVDILWARGLSVMCSLLTLLLLYLLVSEAISEWTAVLSMLMYAIHPGAVVYNRLAFTYNLLAPLYLVGLFALQRYLHTSRQGVRGAQTARSIIWLVVSALCAGLAPVTDLIGLVFLAFMFLVILLSRPRYLVPTALCAILPILIWGVWMWYSAGEVFLFDLAFAFSRMQLPFLIQVAQYVLSYKATLEYDLWLALGTLGLLLLPTRQSRWLLGGPYFMSLIALLRTVNAAGLGYYYLLPLLPFVAMGVASLIARGLPVLISQIEGDLNHLLERWVIPQRWRRLPVFLATALFVFLVIGSFFAAAVHESRLLPQNFAVAYLEATGVLAEPGAAREVAEYVNAHTCPGDVVLSSPTIAWLFDAHAADFQMAIAATGQATQHFPSGIPLERFRFDPRLENARYVVLDAMWRGWGSIQMEAVAEMVHTVEAEWVLEAQFGKFEVYRHPRAPERTDCFPPG